jgi:hypothetical protein
MGDDVVAWAESRPLLHGSQRSCRTNNAIVQQIGMRQVPGTREMPTAGAVAHVLSSELFARTGVEHMSVALKLAFENPPIDQTNGPCSGDHPETALRAPATRRQPGR